MARIRSAKPSWWTDTMIATLTRDVRFTYKGIIEVCCDDEGRFVADPRLIKSQVWPLDDDITASHIDEWLALLEALGKDDDSGEFGRIVLYEVRGIRYGWVVRFLDHQKVSHPSPSKIPPPPLAARIGSVRARPSPTAPVATGDEPPPVPVKPHKHRVAFLPNLADEYPRVAAAVDPKTLNALLKAITDDTTSAGKAAALAEGYLTAAENMMKRGTEAAAVQIAAEDYAAALVSEKEEKPNVSRWRGYISKAHDHMPAMRGAKGDGRSQTSGKYTYEPNRKSKDL